MSVLADVGVQKTAIDGTLPVVSSRQQLQMPFQILAKGKLEAGCSVAVRKIEEGEADDNFLGYLVPLSFLALSLVGAAGLCAIGVALILPESSAAHRAISYAALQLAAACAVAFGLQHRATRHLERAARGERSCRVQPAEAALLCYDSYVDLDRVVASPFTVSAMAMLAKAGRLTRDDPTQDASAFDRGPRVHLAQVLSAAGSAVLAIWWIGKRQSPNWSVLGFFGIAAQLVAVFFVLREGSSDVEDIEATAKLMLSVALFSLQLIVWLVYVAADCACQPALHGITRCALILFDAPVRPLLAWMAAEHLLTD